MTYSEKVRRESIIEPADAKSIRTTLTLESDIYEHIKRYAEANGLGFGKALDLIVRQHMDGPSKFTKDEITGIMVLQLPPDAPKITARQVRQLLDEDF